MKNEAQSFLEKYEMLFVQMECLQAEWQQWHDLAHSITSMIGGERVKSSSAQDKMASAVTKCLAMEDEINSQIDKLIAKQNEVKQILFRLDNPTYCKFLHLKYIQFYSLKEIAEMFHASYEWSTTVHGRALKSLQVVLDLKGEEYVEGSEPGRT